MRLNLSRSAKLLLIGGIALTSVLVLAHVIVPAAVEKRYNKVTHRPPYASSTHAQQLQSQLLIADLHADSLLWGRDLLKKSGVGHVDFPRLREANVALQVFTVVTKTPKNLNIERNRSDTDSITELAIAEGWPPRTWSSLLERALYQADRLNAMASASHGKLRVIHSKTELNQFISDRSQDASLVAAVLGLEGAHALEGDLSNLDRLYYAGFRLAAPTHFFDNDIAGSSAGIKQGGLTPKGRDFVRAMEQRHMIIDLAHASSATIADVTAIAQKPVIVSHTGVRGTCNNQRNLSDEELRRVAATGGIVGIGYWRTAVCGDGAAAIARAIRHASEIIGSNHVALGSDFDGAVAQPFDSSGIVQVTDELLKQGFTKAEIAEIEGGNVVRVMRAVLPEN